MKIKIKNNVPFNIPAMTSYEVVHWKYSPDHNHCAKNDVQHLKAIFCSNHLLVKNTASKTIQNTKELFQ